MIATPKTHHLDFENVYEPAEDSFLLLDALEKDFENVKKAQFCVEIGSGSGIISVALGSVMPQSQILACDINPEACKATQETARVNQVKNVQIIQIDFCKSFPVKENFVDLLVCNPPYVETFESETDKNDIFASWAGGKNGRKLTDRLIENLPKILSQSGVAYIVLEQCNKPESVMKMVQNLGLKGQIVLSRRAGREFLSVAKIEL